MAYIDLPGSSTKLIREVAGEGPLNARILLLTDCPSWGDKNAGRSFSDFAGKLLFAQFQAAGISRAQIRVESICERIAPGRKLYALESWELTAWREDCLKRISNFNPNVIVPLGEDALQLVTDKRSISKWHLSIIKAFNGKKCIPLLHPEYILKVYREIPFLTFGAQRIAQESSFPEIQTTERLFIINPTLEKTLSWLQSAHNSEWLSIDIETGQGQITCIGFSTSATEVLCIPTQQENYTPAEYKCLWDAIAHLLASDSKKILQNGIYDCTYLSAYGIRVRNFVHDTMVAQKFLHPEFPMGLDTIARLYTREPYWKDEGKNWTLRQDINELYYYNCKDVACTFEAAMAQRVDLEKRGLMTLFTDRIMKFQAPAMQMCWAGLPVILSERERLTKETEARISKLNVTLQEESQRLLQRDTNSRSPLQVKELLRAIGFRLPVRDGKESSDRESLMRLRLKDPENKTLDALIGLSEENKKLSSYLQAELSPDNRLHFTMYIHGTETGRWSSSLDPWGRGLNAQTIPSNLKGQFGYD